MGVDNNDIVLTILSFRTFKIQKNVECTKSGLKMHDVQISGEHPCHNNWTSRIAAFILCKLHLWWTKCSD